jgi:hypothetical protein
VGVGGRLDGVGVGGGGGKGRVGGRGWGGDLLKFCVPHVFKVPQILEYVGGWAGCVYSSISIHRSR